MFALPRLPEDRFWSLADQQDRRRDVRFRRWAGLRQLSILCLELRFVFGNKRTNLIRHVQKFQPLLFI